MALWYRYPTALRGGTRCVPATLRHAQDRRVAADRPHGLRILCPVPDRAIPAAAAAGRPRHARPRGVRGPGRGQHRAPAARPRRARDRAPAARQDPQERAHLEDAARRRRRRADRRHAGRGGGPRVGGAARPVPRLSAVGGGPEGGAAARRPRVGRPARWGSIPSRPPSGWRPRSPGRAKPLRVLVEVDSGGHRTGVASPGEAVEVAAAAARAGLAVEGVFTHGGHSYRPAAAGAAGLDEVASLESAAAALDEAGFEVRTVSAGSTPTRTLAAEGRVTEIRAGTYALGDRQQVALGAIDGDGIAAVVAATVVSAGPGRAVLDAGAKALTKDLPAFVDGYGAIPDWPGALIERAVRLPRGRVAGRRRGAAAARVGRRRRPQPHLPGRRPRVHVRRGAARTAASSTGRSTRAAAAAEPGSGIIAPWPTSNPQPLPPRGDLRRRVLAGEPTIGAFVNLGSLVAAELVARAGLRLGADRPRARDGLGGRPPRAAAGGPGHADRRGRARRVGRAAARRPDAGRRAPTG